MKNLDFIVTVIGVVYGLVLMLTPFVRSKITEAMRVDLLFMPNATDSTRPLNLIVGILVAGYGIYSLLGK